ncbi:uncharacterized protein [Pithys albifrons albifrons]|uniref:uncharacterized protein n=1 Tax=Pithys albifrons albifrons TaxID=3385563 RepID=UPI003A5CE556
MAPPQPGKLDHPRCGFERRSGQRLNTNAAQQNSGFLLTEALNKRSCAAVCQPPARGQADTAPSITFPHHPHGTEHHLHDGAQGALPSARLPPRPGTATPESRSTSGGVRCVRPARGPRHGPGPAPALPCRDSPPHSPSSSSRAFSQVGDFLTKSSPSKPPAGLCQQKDRHRSYYSGPLFLFMSPTQKAEQVISSMTALRVSVADASEQLCQERNCPRRSLLTSCFYKQGEIRSGEVKKQSGPSVNAKNTMEERERGNNCETAVLKEETWAHKQQTWSHTRKHDSKRKANEKSENQEFVIYKTTNLPSMASSLLLT